MTDEPEFDTVALAAGIISAYVSHNHLSTSEIPALIQSVHDQLRKLSWPAEPEAERPVPLVPIRKTVTPDHIISLEDGKPYKTLKRHLAGHGLTPEEYRRKWGLPPDYPMVAANYAAQRSELAKSIGLGQQRRNAAAKPAEPKKGHGRPKKAAPPK